MSKVDSAILEALGLNPDQTKITNHGGSGFASTFRLSSLAADGSPVNYFVKTGTGAEYELMFRGKLFILSFIFPDLAKRDRP